MGFILSVIFFYYWFALIFFCCLSFLISLKMSEKIETKIKGKFSLYICGRISDEMKRGWEREKLWKTRELSPLLTNKTAKLKFSLHFFFFLSLTISCAACKFFVNLASFHDQLLRALIDFNSLNQMHVLADV